MARPMAPGKRWISRASPSQWSPWPWVMVDAREPPPLRLDPVGLRRSRVLLVIRQQPAAQARPHRHAVRVRAVHVDPDAERVLSPRSRPLSAATQRIKALRRCPASASLPIRDVWLHPAEGTQHSEARPVPTRQNSRLWMSATSRQSSSAANRIRRISHVGTVPFRHNT